MDVACGSHKYLSIGRSPQKLTLESRAGKTILIKVPKGEDGFDIAMSTLLDVGVIGMGASELYTELTDEDYKTLLSKNPLLIMQAKSGGIMGPLTRAVPGLEFRAPFEEEMKWDLDLSIQDGKIRVTLAGEGDAALIAIEQGKIEEAKKLLLKLTERANVTVRGGNVTGILFIPPKFLQDKAV